jgi:hypothetical protein
VVESKKEKRYIQAVTIIGKSFNKKIKYIILGGLEIMYFIFFESILMEED